MFHNYFFLKRLATELIRLLASHKLGECYSQNKDELILGFFDKNHQLYLKANFNPNIALIDILDEHHRAKRNSVDLFEPLMDATVKEVAVFENERSFSIQFESQNYQALVFKMHGSRSNIIYMVNDTAKAVFRSALVNDYSLTFSSLHHPLPLNVERFTELNGNLKEYLPAVGKEVRSFLAEKHYGDLTINEKWSLWLQTLDSLTKDSIKITENDNSIQLTLLPFDGEILFETTSAVEATKEFYRRFTKRYYLHKVKLDKVQELKNVIKKTEGYLSKSKRKLEEIRNKRGYDEIANILMANLHRIKEGSQEVELEDFYQNKSIKIKLNPKLSPQKNAENLYRKSKNQSKEIQKLEDNIAKRSRDLKEALEELDTVLEADDIRFIKKMNTSGTKDKQLVLPYHSIQYKGYTILVGKHAKSNDELTLKVANKDDLWLHAKDVSGSHVVIKQQPGSNFPKDVIQYAAEIAASHSKRKTDSTCPVIYTPKKYVRKRKGDPAGAMIVEKESILLVAPVNHLIHN